MGELNVVAIDQRIRSLEKHINTLEDNVTLKTSNYDDIEEDLSIVKLAVEQHIKRLRQMDARVIGIVEETSRSGNKFVGAPDTRRLFVFHDDNQVSEDTVKDHMQISKYQVFYLSKICQILLPCSNHSWLQRSLMTSFRNTMCPGVWPPGSQRV